MKSITNTAITIILDALVTISGSVASGFLLANVFYKLRFVGMIDGKI